MALLLVSNAELLKDLLTDLRRGLAALRDSPEVFGDERARMVVMDVLSLKIERLESQINSGQIFHV